jgi:HSP20 family protein
MERRKEDVMLTRWSDFGFDNLDRSFAALSDLRQEMDRALQRFEVDWPRDFQMLSGSATDGSLPAVVLSDEGEQLCVYAEVPGFEPGDLNVSIEQGTLTIRGERRDEIPQGYAVHRKERGAVRFARSIALPARVESDKVEAKLSNGILELRLPKDAAERPRTIRVKAA